MTLIIQWDRCLSICFSARELLAHYLFQKKTSLSKIQKHLIAFPSLQNIRHYFIDIYFYWNFGQHTF